MEVLRLVDRVGVNSMIEDATFTNTLIIGPAVIAPIDTVTMDGCRFDGDAESLFIEVPEGSRALGVIGLRRTTFRDCEFKNIAIIGTPDSISYFRQKIGWVPPDSPEEEPQAQQG